MKEKRNIIASYPDGVATTCMIMSIKQTFNLQDCLKQEDVWTCWLTRGIEGKDKKKGV